jgi:selenocysteine lyase/cysteine desulfurase
VQVVSVQNDVVHARTGSGAFEDGTPNFLAMPAVCDGLTWLMRVGMAAIDEHVRSMTAALLERLATLRDRVRIYGPTDLAGRGGVVAFNLCTHGQVLDYEAVEAAARERGVAIRGGCFCNPGAAEHAFGIPAAAARACLDGQFSIERFRSCMHGLPVGAVRASIGPPTTLADLDRLLALAQDLTGG